MLLSRRSAPDPRRRSGCGERDSKVRCTSDNAGVSTLQKRLCFPPEPFQPEYDRGGRAWQECPAFHILHSKRSTGLNREASRQVCCQTTRKQLRLVFQRKSSHFSRERKRNCLNSGNSGSKTCPF